MNKRVIFAVWAGVAVMSSVSDAAYASVSCYESAGTTYCSGTDDNGKRVDTRSYESAGTTFINGSLGLGGR